MKIKSAKNIAPIRDASFYILCL